MAREMTRHHRGYTDRYVSRPDTSTVGENGNTRRLLTVLVCLPSHLMLLVDRHVMYDQSGNGSDKSSRCTCADNTVKSQKFSDSPRLELVFRSRCVFC